MAEERPRISFLRKLTMGLTAAILFLGLVEIALRIFIPWDSLLFSWERPGNLIELQSEGRVGVRPKAADEIFDRPRSWTYTTNTQGFRESGETPRDKPDGTYRILALGDSFIFGINANQDKSLPAQLEALLPGMLGVGTVDVINVGVPGGSAFDMLTYWRRYGPRYEVDGVLLGQPHNPGKQIKSREARARWYSDVRGPPPVYLYLYMVMRKAWAPYALPAYGVANDTDRTQGAVSDLSRIAAEAQKNGKPVWMVMWPTRWESIQTGEHTNMDDWVNPLRTYGVTFTGHTLAERCCWGYTDTGHPSEAGYRATAELVASLIAQGETTPLIRGEPRCWDVEGDGPGKPGSMPVPDGPNLMQAPVQLPVPPGPPR